MIGLKYRIIIKMLSLVLLFVSCGEVKLSDAREHYVNGEYHKASESYRELYRNTPDEESALRGVISFEMAEANRKINRTARALSGYRNSIRYNYPDSLIYFHYAQMLHREGEYDLAIEAYDDYLDLFPYDRLAVNGKQGAELAKIWIENPTRHKIELVGILNSSRADFSPVLTQKDETLIFTTTREDVTGREVSPITGTKYSDIYISRKNILGEWQKPELLKGEVNTEFDEGTPTFTPDGRYMLYTYSYADPEKATGPKIYISGKINGVWSAGTHFEIVDDDYVSIFAHPAISPSGEYLYCVSDMPGGYGGKDIWRASLSSSLEITSVENMGPEINTPGDEMFPYLRDDDRLYFSSDGHPGMGGLDLFEARYNKITDKWHIENMKFPINSSQDDFGITFERDKEKGYFSSNRNDIRGYDNIYSFEYQPTRIIVEGFAVDPEDEFIAGSSVAVVGSDGTQLNLITDQMGEYRFEADSGVHYVLMAAADGFLNQKQALHVTELDIDTLYYVDFELIPYNKPVILENIFYDFDSATLRPESKSELDGLIELLTDHPEIKIELSANSDRFGDAEYNTHLSYKRAESVLNYLILNGIDGDRLKAVGYGKSNPQVVNRKLSDAYGFLNEGDILTEEFIENLTPEQQKIADQLNRRTDFMVLSP